MNVVYVSGKQCFKRTKTGTKICAFANCTSDGRTLPKDTDVWFVPFPKTCMAYRDEMVNTVLGKVTKCHHDTSKCQKCTRAKLWIKLCHRGDIGLQKLGDIGRNRYVCSKHFASKDVIPCDEDPMPANIITKAQMAKYLRKKRKPPKERLYVEPLKRTKTTKNEELTTTNGDLNQAANEEPGQETTTSNTNGESTTATPESLQGHHKAAETVLVPANLIQNMPTTGEIVQGTQFPMPCVFISIQPPEKVGISGFAEVKMKEGWACALREKYASFIHYDDVNFTCLLEVRVWQSDEELRCEAFVLGAPLPQECEWFAKQLEVKTFPDLQHFMEVMKHRSLCKGITRIDLIQEYAKRTQDTTARLCPRTNGVRAVKCKLFSRGSKCVECLKYEHALKAQIRRRTTPKISKSAHIKCNHRYMTKEQLREKLQVYKKRDIASTAKLKKFQGMITEGPCITSHENDDMVKLLRKAKANIESKSPLGIFLEEQLKAASRKACNGYRWNNDILKWCLYLYKVSPTAYRALRSSSYLMLPSNRKLLDYSKILESNPGFPQEIPEHIATKISDFKGHQEYYSLMFDEMEIVEEIVYRCNTNEMVGFVDLNDAQNELLQCVEQDCIVKPKSLPKRVLQLSVRGLTTDCHFHCAYFGTNCLANEQLYRIIMDAICHLEQWGIKILSIVSDGVHINRSLLNVLAEDENDPHYMMNPFAPDEDRKIYFICDHCQLLKTIRNRFLNSKFPKPGKQAKHLLWKENQYIVWDSVLEVFNYDLQNNPRILPKITDEHVHLTPHGQMKVSFAVQVMSKSMAVALEKICGPETSATVKFVELFDMWFDLHSTRNIDEGAHEHNSNLKPYSSVHDERLMWLENDFVNYLDEWESEVKARAGPFNAADRRKMLLAEPIRYGLKLNSKSIPGAVRFLLHKGANYVSTNRFNQDLVEQGFATQSCAAENNEDTNLHVVNSQNECYIKV